jgi:hypothetical protein
LGRRLLGWSLQELAARTGVNWLTIKKYEDDVQNLSQCAGRPATSSRCKSDTMKE